MDDYFDTLTAEEVRINTMLLEKYSKKQKKVIEKDKKVIEIKDDEKDIIIIEDDVELSDIIEKLPDTYNAKLFVTGFNLLNNFQKDILKECCGKHSQSLVIPMGCGKTLISIVLSLFLTIENLLPTLIVVSKSLISNWEAEIHKFFGNHLKYTVLHQTTDKNFKKWKLNPNLQIILTTVDVIAKFYRENHIDKQFVTQVYTNRRIYINNYNKVTKPYLNHSVGGGVLFSITWGCLIVDEAQNYTNIDTQRCQSLGAIYTNHRWLLSGTLFNEPKSSRILGYHILLDAPNKPRNLPDTEILIKSKPSGFKGLNEYIVYRKENLAYTAPKINEFIIMHQLTVEEVKIYTMMKQILIEVKKKADKAKLLKNEEELKRFNSYKLVMLMYLRQALICPLIPITSIVIDAANMAKKSELSVIIMQELRKLNIDDYLDNEDSIISSRIKETIKCIDKHDEKIIIFSCFKKYLDIMRYIMKNHNRPIFIMDSKMNIKQREALIEAFKLTDNGLLFMTYELGATGLNLQFTRNIILVDQFWNASSAAQGIARINRYGQLAESLNVYFLSANTGIEKMIFEKQSSKLKVISELKTGVQVSKISKNSIDEIIRIIEIEDNRKLLTSINYY